MKLDRPALTPCILVDTPVGRIYEMDVVLSPGELKDAPGFLLEPWVRVTEGAEWELSAGIEVSRARDDDGA